LLASLWIKAISWTTSIWSFTCQNQIDDHYWMEICTLKADAQETVQ